jgi:hypothetical protein
VTKENRVIEALLRRNAGGHPLLVLQRAAGNRTVARLLASHKTAALATPPSNETRKPVWRTAATVVLTILLVGVIVYLLVTVDLR